MPPHKLIPTSTFPTLKMAQISLWVELLPPNLSQYNPSSGQTKGTQLREMVLCNFY